MSVDAATVRRIAHLARIAVTDAEVPHLQGELNAMLAFVEQLSEVNVEGVEPMTSVTPMEMKKRPTWSMTARSPTTWSGTRRRPRTISFWCRKSSNKLRFSRREIPMCMLCDDEKAYAAYMNYLDAMERQGKAADPDKAIDAVLDQLEAADKARRDDPANDKTLSPFFCSPVNK